MSNTTATVSTVSAISPTTVFISSRFEETSASRRAAFDAVLDVGLIPLVFERMPTVTPRYPNLGLYNKSNRSNPPSTATTTRLLAARRLRYLERLVIDDLVSNSDVFLGVYADTIGTPEPFLCGLRPIEYEFIRFIVQAQCRRDPSKFPGGIASVLPPPEDRGGTYVEPPESTELLRVLAHVGSELAALKHVKELRGRAGMQGALDSIYTSLISDPASVAAVFDRQVRLFRKNFSSDKPVSSHLLRNLASKPHFTYQSRREEETDGARPVYFPATADLYRQVYNELAAIKGANVVPPAAECGVAIITNTTPRPGYLRRALREIYHAAFNVDRVAVGKDKRRPGKPRTIVFALSAYHGSTDAAAIQARLKDLQASIINSFVKQQLEMPDVECVASDSAKNTMLIDAIEKHSDSRPDRSVRIGLTASVADVPGMLFRVVERVDAHGGNISRTAVHEPAHAQVKNKTVGRLIPATRRELELLAEFEGMGKSEGGKAEALVHNICAELRFLVGVYDVWGEIL